ncbi:hypothetical protein HaLaN_32930 [Haematococcus lacustris]|uniref:Uncharacterized protein n=1 Tax=Haematococcus lacustris TaxID=44745 RepID=A0A6A0AL65_HAELA|nr:hypothetical protein HaLaN_32930 [Haematococcus lacustris]
MLRRLHRHTHNKAQGLDDDCLRQAQGVDRASHVRAAPGAGQVVDTASQRWRQWSWSTGAAPCTELRRPLHR